MVKSLQRNLDSISKLGSRAEDYSMRAANLCFFGMTLFFSVVYFIIASTEEVGKADGDATIIKDSLTKYLIVVSATSLILAMMEFYPMMSRLMKLIRLICVIALVVFVGLSINSVIDLADRANNDASVTLVYPFASLTLGFAGLASIVNILEVARNSGY